MTHTPDRRWRARRLTAGAALAAATALTLAACGSAGGGGSAGPTTGKITLVVQDGDGGETSLLNGYAALNKAFEAQNPGVTIKFVTKNFTDLVNTLKLQLSGGSPPDITQVNEGYSSMGELVTDKLLLNLGHYAARYGWDSRQPASLLAIDGRMTADGKQLGTGPLWGMAATGAWVGLFENTAAARKLGISAPPATLAELERDLATASAHHVVPLQYGASDGGESSWLLASVLMAQSSAAEVTAIVDGKEGVSLTSPQVLQAADTIKSWAAKNYFTPGWAAYSNSDVFSKFAGGQGLFDLNGSWNVPLPSSARAADFTLVPFPTAAGASTPGGVATGDLAWTIPASSRHQALAAKYLNFITSPQAARVWISTGSVPATMPASLQASISSAHLAGVTRDALTDWTGILAKGNPVPYIDWATPTFYTTIQAALPELAASKISPAQFAQKLQADYGTFAKTR